MPQVGNESRPLVLKGQNRNKNTVKDGTESLIRNMKLNLMYVDVKIKPFLCLKTNGVFTK